MFVFFSRHVSNNQTFSRTVSLITFFPRGVDFEHFLEKTHPTVELKNALRGVPLTI